MLNTHKYSIVVPVYNSDQSLMELCTRIDKALQAYNYEVVLVDDGSSDNSWQVINTIKQNLGNKVTAISLNKNHGQHTALFCGFQYCKGDFIITMDDDLQHPPEEIVKLIAKQDEAQADVVYGIYEVKHHSALRNSGSFFVRKTSNVAGSNSGLGSSFRLVRKSIIDQIVQNQKNVFFYLDEVFYWYTASFAYVNVQHQPRSKGESGYTMYKLLSLYFGILVNYTAWPLRLMTYVGLIFAVVNFLLGISFILRKLFFRAPLGFTALIVAVLFSTGILMLCMGIIGQYLFKIYIGQQSKPPYSIRQILK